MKYQVKKKQQNCRKCLVCGLKNEFGLKASFYELENNELVAIFKPLEEHQSLSRNVTWRNCRSNIR